MENGASIAGITTITFELVLLALAGLAACAAAIFTALAAKATAKASRGVTILTCLDKYLSVMKDKRAAIENENSWLAKEFYRELFDLHWSEFHLWHEGAIPNYVIRAWITIRKRNFAKDEIICTSKNGTQEKISYADVWGDLKSTGYFELDDPFVKFMDLAHTADIGNVKKLKKQTKKRKRK